MSTECGRPKASTASVEFWDSQYRRLVAPVLNFLRYRGLQLDQAEELTSITFEKAWSKRSCFDQKKGSVAAWLFGIALNVLRDYRKKPEEQSLQDTAVDASVPSPDAALERQADREKLRRLLCGLSERERNIVALKYGGELSNIAIGQIMKVSATNVGTILCRVIKRLASQWEEING